MILKINFINFAPIVSCVEVSLTWQRKFVWSFLRQRKAKAHRSQFQYFFLLTVDVFPDFVMIKLCLKRMKHNHDISFSLEVRKSKSKQLDGIQRLQWSLVEFYLAYFFWFRVHGICIIEKNIILDRKVENSYLWEKSLVAVYLFILS